MRRAVTGSTLTVPDGMPLVWAANLLGENLHNRVYGPELMDRYCARCAERGHRLLYDPAVCIEEQSRLQRDDRTPS